MRNASLDILKFVMAVMVLCIHAGFLKETSDLFAFLFNQGVFRIAVPIFFIINGYFFCPALRQGNALSWIRKVTLLYITWAIIFAAFWIDFTSGGLFGLLKNLHTVLFGYFHLWYLPATIGAALLMLILKEQKVWLLIGLSIGLYFIGVLIQYLGNYHFFTSPSLEKITNMSWTYRNSLFFGFPFFCVGYLINSHSILQKSKTITLYTLVILGFFLLLLESFLNFNSSARNEGFDLCISLPLIAPALFIIVMNTHLKLDVGRLALYSTAVYFFHPLAITMISGAIAEGTTRALIALCITIITSVLLVRLKAKFEFIL